ncbi:hypothetical protein LJR098_001100 [Rhizobium sp. LjRoot98]|uniref:hypothetical protein n=1 Tax=Rhizobium sp. LjRoot98 TaxID=3342345 RepID=UPI003ECE4BD9
MIRASFSYNSAAIRQELDAIGQRVLPRALAEQLNATAFLVSRKVVDELRRSVSNPKPFTLRPMKVTKARWQDGDRMFASVDMQDKQADYLWFPITGATRHPGDPGTARTDIMTFAAQPTSFGGAFNKPRFRAISKKHRKEVTGRAALRVQRVAHRGQGRLPDALRWVKSSRNAPGLFFGTVNGTKGYWQRPDRYSRAERNGLINAARSQAGHIPSFRFHASQVTAGSRGGSNLSWTKPGSRLKLLLAFQPTVRAPVTVHYDTALHAGYLQQMTEANFVRVLQDKKAWFMNRP